MIYIKMQINFTFRDSEFSYNDTELSLYQRVKGNCDFYPEFLEEAITEENGVRAFILMVIFIK